MTNKRMKELVGVISSEGGVISYDQYLREQGGSGAIYDDYHQEILEAANHPDTDWQEALDILAPLTREILTEAIQVDKEIYKELVNAINKAYLNLKAMMDEDKEFIINKNTVDVFAVLESLLLHLNSGWTIKECDFNAFADYRVVITKENSNV